jgi:hypothetical protein
MKVVIHDGLAVAIEKPDDKRTCVRGVLLFDPTENGAHPMDTHPRQPAAGETAMRIFLMLETEGACDAALESRTRMQGLAAGAYVFATSEGEPIAIQLVGYMFSAVFAAPGRTAGELAPILERSRREIEHQAE